MRETVADVTVEGRIVKAVIRSDYNSLPTVLKNLVELAPFGFVHPVNGQIVAAYRAARCNGGSIAAHLESDHALMLEIYQTSREVESIDTVVREARLLVKQACEDKLKIALGDIQHSPSQAWDIVKALVSSAKDQASNEQERWSISQLIDYDHAHDPNAVVGLHDGITTRYLCKGSGAWLIGQCLHGDTPIFDPVDNTTRTVRARFHDSKPFHVISLKAGIPTVMRADAPHRFDPQPMIRLTFSNGESITVTPAHRILTDRGYEFSFDAAQRLQRFEPVLLPSISDTCPSTFQPGVLCSIQTTPNSQAGYPGYHHSGDAQPHLDSIVGPATPPLPTCAHEPFRDCLPPGVQEGKVERIHHRPGTFHHSMPGSILQLGFEVGYQPPVLSSISSESLCPSQPPPRHTIFQTDKVESPSAFYPGSKAEFCGYRTSDEVQVSSTSSPPLTDSILSLSKISSDPIPGCNSPIPDLECLVGCSLSNYTTVMRLVKAEMLPSIHEYYDFFVPETNNYYACGAFHHNSGIGKSSLAIQQGFTWALGRSFFGITPVRPLRVLIVQNENDKGDCSEATQGVCKEICHTEEDMIAIEERARVIRCRGKTGSNFCHWLEDEVNLWKADVVYVDPLLRYAGIDVSRQDQCTNFLNNLLDPMLASTGVVLIGAHHTGKPKSSRETQGWTVYDHAYAGIGSSELVNWARAISILRSISEENKTFDLLLAKRGNRARATHPTGELTIKLYLRHSDSGMCWEQLEPTDVPRGTEEKSSSAGRPSKIQEIASMNLHEFCRACKPEGEGQREIARRLENWLATQHIDSSLATCRRVIGALVANQKIKKTESDRYVAGKEA